MNCNFTKKAVRIINFQPRNSHTSPLFKEISILKYQDKICLENILFVIKSLNNFSPPVFNTCFSLSSDQHNNETSSSTQDNLNIFNKANIYGKYSVAESVAESLRKIRKQLKHSLLKDLPPNKIKTVVTCFYFKLITYLIMQKYI